MKRIPRVRWILLSLVVAALFSQRVRANTGVSDERVSLPDGPGSAGGVGENLSAGDNLGAMTYQVPLEVPAGFAGATPQLSLSYSSMQGNEVLGVGWDMVIPHIERFTLRGLPRYAIGDGFAANGSDELVRVGTTADVQVYRARYEQDFIRYSWHAPGEGGGGYWEAEYPDGTRGYFGADSQGRTVPEARLTHPEREEVFRYMLVETVDEFGHSVHYRYQRPTDGDPSGAYPLVERIEYVADGAGAARYQIDFGYEPRVDVLSNALPGFEVRLDQRLSDVEVRVGGAQLRRYHLYYEEAAAGTSRLKRVERFGAVRDGVKWESLFPVTFSFEYSSSLNLDCGDCARPVLFEMGNLTASAGQGVDFRNGRATLIDINGDALPDVVETGETGHRFFLNQLAPDGRQRFSAAKQSAYTGTLFQLQEAPVQVADINGDGFSDMFHAGQGEVLCNYGTGDWVPNGSCRGTRAAGLQNALVSDLGEAGDPDPLGVRFFDYDGDRRIDMLVASGRDVANVWHNQGTEQDREIPLAEGLGRAFDEGNLQLSDLNGDGLLDLVEISDTGDIWSRLYLGYGHWQAPSEPAQQLWAGAGLTDFQGAELQDVNGDGLDDVVIVRADSVYFWLNQAGRFLPVQVLNGERVGTALPDASDPATSVLFADMNASGSIDVVWVNSSDASVKVLELHALRPNLLTQIDNGIGGIQRVEYGTSALEQARDEAAGVPWRHRLPLAVQVVTATERTEALTPGLALREEQTYHHGYYDGRHKQYRGFEKMEVRTPGDLSQETGLRVLDYHVGAGDPYLRGRVQGERVYSGDGENRRELRQTVYTYDPNCPLAEVPKTEPAVRFVCEVSRETFRKEGLGKEDWVLLATTSEYDGYGNVRTLVNHGVRGRGAHGANGCGSCDAPEGTQSGACDRGDDPAARCLGDESTVTTEYIPPGPDTTGGRWNLRSPWRHRQRGTSQDEFTETLYYYDGDPFQGLRLGRLDRGLLTRSCERATPRASPDCRGKAWVEALRRAYDEHGNVVTELDPLANASDAAGDHRRELEYDATYGLLPTAEVLYLQADKTSYRLRRETSHDPLFDLPQAMTHWMVEGAQVDSPRAETLLRYDAFGRLAKVAQPGDTLEFPTREFEYHLGAPVSRVVTRARSRQGEAPDWESVQCLSGFGHTVQRRTLVEAGVYQVTGFEQVNAQGLAVRSYQPYQGGVACDQVPPEDVAHEAYSYDSMGRLSRQVHADAELFGSPSETRMMYAPLVTTTYDAGDNDPDSAAFDTPRRRVVDGLGRVVRYDRVLDTDGAVGSVRVLWDALGRVAGHLDPGGNRHRQTTDLLGRVRSVHSPDRGGTRFRYDAAGNLIWQEDARGEVVCRTYDGLNRLESSYDQDNPEETRLELRYDFDPECPDCGNAAARLVRRRYPLGGTDGEGLDVYGFDLRGRVVSLSRTLSGNKFLLTTDYDNLGRVVAGHYPDQTTLKFRYDGVSRPVAIEGVIRRASYDVRGLLRSVEYENGALQKFGHDARQRLASTEVRDAAGGMLLGLEQLRDRTGTIVALSDLRADVKEVSRGVGYEHDAWSRTTGALFDDGETVEVGFDRLDNITHKVSSRRSASAANVGTYIYDSGRPHAVSRAGTLSLRYDEAGNLRGRQQRELEWDYQGRLIAAHGPRGADAEYAYAGSVDRVLERHGRSTTYFVAPNFEMRDGIAVTYVRLGGRRVARLSSDKLATDVLGDENENDLVDVGDAWSAREDDSAFSAMLVGSARRMLMAAEAGPVFLHGDGLGSLVLATSAEGSVCGERQFFSTGELRWQRGHVDLYGFTGQRRDPTTGLSHFQFRELDTLTGRWASPDPLFARLDADSLALSGQATTAYAYVAGAFSTATDPTGLSMEVVEEQVGLSGQEKRFMHHFHKGLSGEMGSEVVFVAAGPPPRGEDSVSPAAVRIRNERQLRRLQSPEGIRVGRRDSFVHVESRGLAMGEPSAPAWVERTTSPAAARIRDHRQAREVQSRPVPGPVWNISNEGAFRKFSGRTGLNSFLRRLVRRPR